MPRGGEPGGRGHKGGCPENQEQWGVGRPESGDWPQLEDDGGGSEAEGQPPSDGERDAGENPTRAAARGLTAPRRGGEESQFEGHQPGGKSPEPAGKAGP